MPSISPRLRPASAAASSAALLMRSSEEEPSCLPYAVRPTPVTKLMLIRLRQAQHLLGDKTENELGADRGDARDQGFPQVTLDMIFLGIPKTAVRHHRLLAGLKTSFGREIFCRIGGRPAGQSLVILPARRHHHHPRRFSLHPVFCQRMLDRLVLADRAVEHDA